MDAGRRKAVKRSDSGGDPDRRPWTVPAHRRGGPAAGLLPSLAAPPAGTLRWPSAVKTEAHKAELVSAAVALTEQ